jgi:lipid II:glycine glycyltransferase (peptidoglycan interpeptide bridge formation enzyme)
MSQFVTKPGFTAQVDQMSEQEWVHHLQQFDDANFYQTWQYNALMPGGKHRSHIVLARNGQVVALAQVRIVKLPYISRGIAYVYRGPIWQLRGKHSELDILKQIVSAMHREYVCRRNLLLRIVPNILIENNNDSIATLKSAGLTPCTLVYPYRTILLDISIPLDQLRKGLRQKWRNCLNSADRNNLTIHLGTSDSMFAAFCELYNEMWARKHFHKGLDVNAFRIVQRILPDSEKMIVVLAEYKKEKVAAAVTSALGNTGIYLLAALKEQGCNWFDLGGIDPERDSGGYHFKSGLGGKACCFIGWFEAYNSSLSKLVVTIGEGIKDKVIPSMRRLLKPIRD